MTQCDLIRIVRAILAVGCLTAGSVCVGAGHVASASRIRGVVFGAPGNELGAYFRESLWLFVVGGVLFVLACVLAASALSPAQRRGGRTDGPEEGGGG